MGFVLLRYQKESSVIEKPSNPSVAALSKESGGNALISVKDWIVAKYNIPVLTPEQLQAISGTMSFSTVSPSTRSYVDAEGVKKTTAVREFSRIASATVRRGKPIAVPHPDHRNASNEPLYVGIKMPSFFTIPMLSQALGQMFTTNRPRIFRLSRTNQVYPIIYNTTDGLLPNWKAGAWVVTVDAPDQNVLDTDAPNSTLIYGADGELAF
jgi:hypothetical protein